MGTSATPNCVLLKGVTSGTLLLNSWTDTAAVVGTGVGASLPIAISTITCGTAGPQALGGFSDTCWNSNPGTTLAFDAATGTQIVYRYQKAAATTYYEVGSTETIWTMTTLGAAALYKSNAITMKGGV